MPNAEPPGAGPVMSFHPPLPADIAAHRVKLAATHSSVSELGRYMDGYFFGVVGADGFVSLVPVVGDIFGGIMTFWLVVKATQVRMPLPERAIMVGLGVLDTAIGMMPGVGDVADFFFRSHGWSARRVQAHIEMQLRQIDALGALPDDDPRVERLRDTLFRGGKTKQQVWQRWSLLAAACAITLAYCSYEADRAAQRQHERVMACEARGGWFCGWR